MGAWWGLALPNTSLSATCQFWGHYFGEGGAPGWQKPLLHQHGVWGAMTPHFFPNSQEGHSLSCHGFSCQGAAILSAARGHAQLGTKGGLA